MRKIIIFLSLFGMSFLHSIAQTTIVVHNSDGSLVDGTYTLTNANGFEYYFRPIDNELSYSIQKNGEYWVIYQAINAQATGMYRISSPNSTKLPCDGYWTNLVANPNRQEFITVSGDCAVSNASTILPNLINVPQKFFTEFSYLPSQQSGSLFFDVYKSSLKIFKNGFWNDVSLEFPFSKNFSGSNSIDKLFTINSLDTRGAIMGSSSFGTGIYGNTVSGIGGYFKANDISGYALATDGKIKISGQGASVDKILTSDTDGNATWQVNKAINTIGFYANTTISTTFADNVLQFVPFTVERFDDGNNFNLNSSGTSPNRFVAPYDGVYHFDAKVIWTAFTGTTRYKHQLIIRIENSAGSQIFTSFDNSYFSNDEEGTNQLSMNISLNAGEKVVLAVSHNSPITNLSLNATADRCFFSGYLVYKK